MKQEQRIRVGEKRDGVEPVPAGFGKDDFHIVPDHEMKRTQRRNISDAVERVPTGVGVVAHLVRTSSTSSLIKSVGRGAAVSGPRRRGVGTAKMKLRSVKPRGATPFYGVVG